MSDHEARIRTINALLTGTCISNDHAYNLVRGEFNAIHESRNIAPNSRRWLVEIVHATRGIDTALLAFIRQRPVPLNGQRQPRSIGQSLALLQNHTNHGIPHLPPNLRAHFQNGVVRPRNLYVHEAGRYPNQVNEVRTLLSEIQACLIAVLAL